MSVSVSQHAFTAKQVLNNEAKVANSQGIALAELMEHAGRAVFDEIAKLNLREKTLLVVCGKGNNGGDGFVVARLALAAGYQVSTVVLANKNQLKGDALLAYTALAKVTNDIEFITEFSQFQCWQHDQKIEDVAVIVDAIFGIGFRGQLPDYIANIIQQLNLSSALKVAVDLPSGVNASTGEVINDAFQADKTLSFIAAKCGLYTGQAANYCGDIELKGLNLNQAFCQQVNTKQFIQYQQHLPLVPKRKATSHKGDIGLLLTLGGNTGFPGAIKLASMAALRSGAALVSVASHYDSRLLVHSQTPELMIAGHELSELAQNDYLSKAKQILIGPGLGLDTWAKSIFNYALSLNKPLVVDADALTLLSQSPSYRDNWVLTPHPGEAARLLGCTIAEIEQDRFLAIAKITEKYGGICVLKGAGTLISDGKYCWINTSGNPSMASGGMGDVLSGIIAALLMQMNDKLDAVRLAVFLHGYIADNIVKQQGEIGLLASDIVSHIPTFINKLA
ncbi:NAD(P)H-hydrate dehydratase [Thalassotalea agariperforans]